MMLCIFCKMRNQFDLSIQREFCLFPLLYICQQRFFPVICQLYSDICKKLLQALVMLCFLILITVTILLLIITLVCTIFWSIQISWSQYFPWIICITVRLVNDRFTFWDTAAFLRLSRIITVLCSCLFCTFRLGIWGSTFTNPIFLSRQKFSGILYQSCFLVSSIITVIWFYIICAVCQWTGGITAQIIQDRISWLCVLQFGKICFCRLDLQTKLHYRNLLQFLIQSQ